MTRHLKSIEEGQSGEDRFAAAVADAGYEIRKASFNENVYKHIDFYVDSSNGTFAVDVKAQKRASRGSKAYDNKYTWIEFKNVQGRKGWLYGEADKIAFEGPNGFSIVSREELVTLCESLVDREAFVSSAGRAINKVYTRNGRKDVISRIETSQIESLPSCRLIG